MWGHRSWGGDNIVGGLDGRRCLTVAQDALVRSNVVTFYTMKILRLIIRKYLIDFPGIDLRRDPSLGICSELCANVSRLAKFFTRVVIAVIES